MRPVQRFLAGSVVLLAAAAAPAAVNMTVLSHVDIPGFTDALFVHDQLVFLLNSQGPGARTLQIYDASDPANPALLSSAAVPGRIADMHGLYYSNGIVYAGIEDPGGGVAIFDVSDPAAPQQLSLFPVPEGAHNLRYAAGYLYVMGDGFGDVDLRVVDVSDPASPVEVNAVDRGGFCHDLSVMEGVGYGSWWTGNGLVLLDLGDPLAIQTITSYRDPTGPTTQSMHSAWPSPDRKTVFTCQEDTDLGLRSWDVTQDPPQLLATYNLGPDTVIHDVMVVGRYAYVSYYGNGLKVLDVGDPAVPVEAGSIETGAPCAPASVFCHAIAQWVEDGLVYLLDMDNGLWIFSFDLPHEAPITVHAVKRNAGADVALSWNHTGESQYTVRRYLTKPTVAGARLTDVDGELRHSDAGVVPDGTLYYYKVNGPWK